MQDTDTTPTAETIDFDLDRFLADSARVESRAWYIRRQGKNAAVDVPVPNEANSVAVEAGYIGRETQRNARLAHGHVSDPKEWSPDWLASAHDRLGEYARTLDELEWRLLRFRCEQAAVITALANRQGVPA